MGMTTKHWTKLIICQPKEFEGDYLLFQVVKGTEVALNFLGKKSVGLS